MLQANLMSGAAITEERSQSTTASPEAVWRVWSDTSSWPKWNPDVRAIQLNGFFSNGVRGTMTTSAGTHRITLSEVVPEQSFVLVTSPIPLTTFHFRCTIQPQEDGGAIIGQSISMRGPLSVIVGPMMRRRIADGFVPILKGLAARAERLERHSRPLAKAKRS